MNLYKKACESALMDIYWDLAVCNKLSKSHPDWEWLKDKKAELEAKERELVSCIRKLQKTQPLVYTNIQKEDSRNEKRLISK